MNINNMPKLELHLHLEGAAPPRLINSLAMRKGIDLTRIFSKEGNYSFQDFKHFLEVYEAATTVLETPQDFYTLTMSVLKECAANNVVYVETFLSPQFCGGNDPVAWKDFLSAIRTASEDAEVQFGIISRGIVTAIRHLGSEVAKATANCAVEVADDWIVGFGMAGDESIGQQKDYLYSFDMARAAGLKLTSHAGEWCGSSSVADAVNDLRVHRVGHGVQAINDQYVVDLLIEKEIPLEICPGSNVFLGVYPHLGSHPIQKLREMGVKTTVSTDDPPFFRTSMNKEYRDLEKTFNWTKKDFIELNQIALEAAFCDSETKEKIAMKLSL